MRKIFQMTLLLMISSCGYSNTEIPERAVENAGGTSSTQALDYATVKAQVFTPHCIRCHGGAGGVTLSDFASTSSSIARIKAAVNSGRMPPSGGLPASAKNVLNLWINAGAPEVSAGATNTTAGTGGGGTTGTGGGGDCDDDRILIEAGLVKEVSVTHVYDTEQEVIRPIKRGCD